MKLPSLLAVVICISFVAPVFAQKPELVVQTGHSTDKIYHIKFSPDGKMLATAGWYDQNVKLWSVETGKEIASLRYSNTPLFSYNSLAWRQGSLYLTTGTSGKMGANHIRYNTVSKQTALTVPLQVQKNKLGDYSPDGKFLCLASDSIWAIVRGDTLNRKDSVTILETTSGNIRAILPLSGNTMGIFSPDGKYLITIDDKKKIFLWDAQTFAFIRVIPILAINFAFSPDGQTLALVSDNKEIQIVYLPTDKIVATLKGHSQKINDIVFSPNGKYLYSTSNDSTIKVWDIAGSTVLKSFNNFPASTATVVVSPDGKTLAMTTLPAKRVVYLLDAETGKALHVLRGGVKGSLGEISLDKDNRGFIATRKDITPFVNVDADIVEEVPEILHKWDFTSVSQSATNIQKKFKRSETALFRTVQDTLILAEASDSLVAFWNPKTTQIMRQIPIPTFAHYFFCDKL